MIRGEEGDDLLLGGSFYNYGGSNGADYDWIYGDEGDDVIAGQ